MTRIVTPGVVGSLSLGDFPLPFFDTETYEGMGGLWLFGTDMPKQRPASETYRELGDFSGQGDFRNRLLGRHGSITLGVNYAPLSSTGFYSIPYTPAELLVENGEATFAAVILRQNVSSAYIGAYNGSTGKSMSVHTAANGAYQISARKSDDTGVAAASISGDGYSGTGYELLVGTFTTAAIKLYRIAPAIDSSATNNAQTFGLAGAEQMRIGTSVSANFLNANRVAAAAVWDRALGTDEIHNSVYTGWQTFLAGIATPITI